MLLKALLLLAIASPVCLMAAADQVKSTATPAVKTPIVHADGRVIMVTGGPVIELHDYTPTPTPGVSWCVVDTGGPALMVRSTPELDPKDFENKLGVVQDGDRLRVLGLARTNGRTKSWYHVRVSIDGAEIEGWVAVMYCRAEVEE